MSLKLPSLNKILSIDFGAYEIKLVEQRLQKEITI